MMDKPTLLEIVTAVREFIEQKAIPALSGHTAFHARVAANALAIAERHAQQLPRLTVLLDQQLGVAAGAGHGMQLSSAMQTIDALEAHIEHLPAPPVVSATPARTTHTQEAP